MNPLYSHRHIRGQEVHCSRYLNLRRADVRKPSIQIYMYVLSTLDNSVVFTPLSAAPLCCATDARARPGVPQPGQTRPDYQGLWTSCCTLQDAINFRVHVRMVQRIRKWTAQGTQKPDCQFALTEAGAVVVSPAPSEILSWVLIRLSPDKLPSTKYSGSAQTFVSQTRKMSKLSTSIHAHNTYLKPVKLCKYELKIYLFLCLSTTSL